MGVCAMGDRLSRTLSRPLSLLLRERGGFELLAMQERQRRSAWRELHREDGIACDDGHRLSVDGREPRSLLWVVIQYGGLLVKSCEPEHPASISECGPELADAIAPGRWRYRAATATPKAWVVAQNT